MRKGLESLIGRDPNLGPIYMNTLPVEVVDPRDISNAVLFLASDEAQYVTGLEFTIDAGNTNTVLGVFDGSELRVHWRLTTRREQTADEYAILVRSLFASSTSAG